MSKPYDKTQCMMHGKNAAMWRWHESPRNRRCTNKATQRAQDGTTFCDDCALFLKCLADATRSEASMRYAFLRDSKRIKPAVRP